MALLSKVEFAVKEKPWRGDPLPELCRNVKSCLFLLVKHCLKTTIKPILLTLV